MQVEPAQRRAGACRELHNFRQICWVADDGGPEMGDNSEACEMSSLEAEQSSPEKEGDRGSLRLLEKESRRLGKFQLVCPQETV